MHLTGKRLYMVASLSHSILLALSTCSLMVSHPRICLRLVYIYTWQERVIKISVTVSDPVTVNRYSLAKTYTRGSLLWSPGMAYLMSGKRAAPFSMHISNPPFAKRRIWTQRERERERERERDRETEGEKEIRQERQARAIAG